MDFRPLKKMPLTRDPVENMIHLQMIYILKMLFYTTSYVSFQMFSDRMDYNMRCTNNTMTFNVSRSFGQIMSPLNSIITDVCNVIIMG